MNKRNKSDEDLKRYVAPDTLVEMNTAIIKLLLLFLVGLCAVGVQLWALIDCLRAPQENFLRMSKRTKPFWLILTGLSLAVGLLFLRELSLGFLLLFNAVACVASGTYLADVRPAVHRSGPKNPDSAW